MIRRLVICLITSIAIVSIVSMSVRHSRSPSPLAICATLCSMGSFIRRTPSGHPIHAPCSPLCRFAISRNSRIFLGELYDPLSPSYRQFSPWKSLPPDSARAQEDYDAVIHFANANGLIVVGTSRNRLNVTSRRR